MLSGYKFAILGTSQSQQGIPAKLATRFQYKLQLKSAAALFSIRH